MGAPSDPSGQSSGLDGDALLRCRHCGAPKGAHEAPYNGHRRCPGRATLFSAEPPSAAKPVTLEEVAENVRLRARNRELTEECATLKLDVHRLSAELREREASGADVPDAAALLRAQIEVLACQMWQAVNPDLPWGSLPSAIRDSAREKATLVIQEKFP